jgi:hypothetical protein
VSIPENRPTTPEELIRQLHDLIEDVNKSPLARGRLLDTDVASNAIVGKGIAFTGGTAKSIPHKLGRTARGFIEVCSPANPSAAHVGLRATAHPSGLTSDTHITATAASSGTCFVWVF